MITGTRIGTSQRQKRTYWGHLDPVSAMVLVLQLYVDWTMSSGRAASGSSAIHTMNR